jgi:hypothetical protein
VKSLLKRLGLEGRTAVTAVPYLWLLLFFLIPFVIVLKISFSTSQIAMPPYEPLLHWTGEKVMQIKLNLGNFAFLVEDDLYWRAYLNSIKVAAVSTILCLLIGYPMAYAMGQRAGATWIVVVQLSREGRRTRVRARALPMRAGESPRVLASALVDERQLGGAADELAARLAARLAPVPVAPPPPPPQRRVKLLRAWWFWTAVIVVVAGVATAAVVATRDQDPRVQLVLTR